MAFHHLVADSLGKEAGEYHDPVHGRKGGVVSSVLLPPGDVGEDWPKEVCLGNPEAWCEGVAVGFMGAHCGSDEPRSELSTQDACPPEFLEEGVSVNDTAVVEPVPQGCLEACVVADGAVYPVA